MQIVEVDLGDRSYPVIIESGGFLGLGAAVASRVASRMVVVVTDEVVGPLWGEAAMESLSHAGLRPQRIELPSGEAHKNLGTFAHCLDEVLQLQIDRKTPIVAVGGGVVGDIAGFVAASALRGLPFIQVPTTLLAMVDSSVGGKTGINHETGKNRIGAFHQPILVFAPLAALSTLPIRERRAGLAEVVKTALLGDPALFAQLEAEGAALVNGDPERLGPVIARCVRVKAEIVAADERESGVRAILNLGHTVGHALENALGYGTLLHGEAVAIGLVAETRWAIRSGICEDSGLADRLATLFERCGLPMRAPKAPRQQLCDALLRDKKATNGHVRVPLPVRSGKVVLVEHPLERLVELLEDLP